MCAVFEANSLIVERTALLFRVRHALFRVFGADSVFFRADDGRTDPAKKINLALRETAARKKPAAHRHEVFGFIGIQCTAGCHRLLPVSVKPFNGFDACRRLLFKALLPGVELMIMVRVRL